jgi:hypothetical protein
VLIPSFVGPDPKPTSLVAGTLSIVIEMEGMICHKSRDLIKHGLPLFKMLPIEQILHRPALIVAVHHASRPAFYHDVITPIADFSREYTESMQYALAIQVGIDIGSDSLECDQARNCAGLLGAAELIIVPHDETMDRGPCRIGLVQPVWVDNTVCDLDEDRNAALPLPIGGPCHRHSMIITQNQAESVPLRNLNVIVLVNPVLRTHVARALHDVSGGHPQHPELATVFRLD